MVAIAFYSHSALSATNTILADQTFFYEENDGQLNVEFNVPMEYISHFPAKDATTLKIRMKELFPSTQISNRIRDQLLVSEKTDNPATRVSYEQFPGENGVLTIEFSRSVDFAIKMGRDRKNLTIRLKNIKARSTRKPVPAALRSNLPIYVLNLKSSNSPIDPKNQPALKKFKRYDIYTTEVLAQFDTTYSLHLGYFHSPSAAKANLKNLKPFYPQGWISKINPKRRDTAEAWFLNTKLKSVKSRQKSTSAKKPDKLDKLMERARQAMLDKDYKSAIRLFTRILELDNDRYHKVSRELLGLARERNGQFAHAKAEYQKYMKLYPEGEDAERVHQRLLGLLTAASRPKPKLKGEPTKTKEPEWDFFGSLFQFYRTQYTSNEVTPSFQTDSSLASDILFTGRKRGFEFNQRFDIGGNHRTDFLNDDDKTDGRLHTFYYDISKRDDDYGARIGRQSHSSDGVLGRFDGIIFNKRIGTDHKINFLAGYPVDFFLKDSLNTDRQFFGLSYDMEALISDADFKFYALNQTNNGLTDRQAIGTEVKFINETSSYFALLDYDVFYSVVNQFRFNATWRNKANSTLNIVADHRKSPLLTTNNALIGQGVASMDELKALYTDDEIYQLAEDRTGTYTGFTVSASTFLSERYQLNGDITISELDGTVASGGVDAIEGTGIETVFNTTLVINNLLSANDITLFGARFLDLASSNVIQFNYSTNFNLNPTWRLNPRLVIDHRDNDNGTSRISYRPRLIANYNVTRSFKLELDMGYDSSDTSGGLTDQSEDSFYLFFGYIYDF